MPVLFIKIKIWTDGLVWEISANCISFFLYILQRTPPRDDYVQVDCVLKHKVYGKR